MALAREWAAASLLGHAAANAAVENMDSTATNMSGEVIVDNLDLSGNSNGAGGGGFYASALGTRGHTPSIGNSTRSFGHTMELLLERSRLLV